MIPVTKPFLPPAKKYQSYVEDIFARNILTNNCIKTESISIFHRVFSCKVYN